MQRNRQGPAHAQSATASLITTQGGDYLLTGKANQPGTQQAIRDYLPATLAGTHWQIENRLHWRLDDVIMNEDGSRARSGEAPANLTILRKITLNSLKVHAPFPGKKGAAKSIRSQQYAASIDPNYHASLIKAPALTFKCVYHAPI